MNSVEKTKSFIKGFVAKVKGDDAEALAQKTLRQADSALKSQIASLNGDTINLEDAVTSAKEAQADAVINNGKLITDREAYIENLLTAKNRVAYAEEELKEHLDKIAYLQSTLDSLSEEV